MADTGMKKTLGLTGVTVNAMALIAPGAFLWITFQIQAANNGGATDMWTGIVAALIVAFLTAMSFSEMARRYPEAGAGGPYYFAEKAFLDRDKAHHQKFARILEISHRLGSTSLLLGIPRCNGSLYGDLSNLYFRTVRRYS